jgi:hypothetical protein
MASPVVYGQFHPVQVTTQLIPPYSVYLPDYATPGNDKLRLIMLQRDLSRPAYQVRLQLSVELNGRIILQTSRAFNPPPINLDPGIPTIITGVDLQPYLNSNNLDFVGYSRTEYERTKALPEGSYQICFTAYDYKRADVRISESACSFYWLAKDEPPLINFPACGMGIPLTNPQQIIFSWLPRNTSSPNSAAETEYEFSLYEMRPAGRNPNDVVLSSTPVYRTVTDIPQLVYGPAEPLLFPDLTYVWRVRAIDKNGKDQFRNHGYSEVCTFMYGAAHAIQWQPITELQAEGETERRAKAWWTEQTVEGYKVHYKKTGSSHQWFSQDTDRAEILLFDLEPNTKYEVRVQPKIDGVYGPYSDIKEFQTLKPKQFQCGDKLDVVPESGNPLPFATVGMMVDVQGIIMTIKEVEGPFGAGLYNGKGEVSIPYFGGATFNVSFNQLYINENRMAVNGRIDFITKGVDAMIEEQLAAQKKREREEKQQENREQWKGTDFYSKIFYYDEIEIDSMYTNEEGHVIMVGADGKSYVNKDIPAILADAPEKSIIIEDKNGDQWVVQKNGKVTRVQGGGLSPTMDVVVSQEALDMVKEALTLLYNEHNEDRIATDRKQLEESEGLLDVYIEEYNSFVTRIESSGGIEADTVDFMQVEIVEIAEPGVNGEFEDLSLAFKTNELNYNRGLLLHFLGNGENINKASELISLELKVGNLPVSEHVDKERRRNVSQDDILLNVKDAIVYFVNEIINNTQPVE